MSRESAKGIKGGYPPPPKGGALLTNKTKHNEVFNHYHHSPVLGIMQ